MKRKSDFTPLCDLCCSFVLKVKPYYMDLLEICCRYADWPSLQQISSKSVVSPTILERLWNKFRSFCHQRICLQHHDSVTTRDKSVVSPANPFDVVQNGQIYSKSTAFINIDEISSVLTAVTSLVTLGL